VGSKSDTSLYILANGSTLMYFLIYVDDIIVTGPDPQAIFQLISSLQKEFALKDLGPLHYFLGVEALPASQGLFLTQRKYISDLLKKANMAACKPITSPMSSSTNLSQFDGAAFSDPSLYRSVVGSLQYLSLTRPDVSFAVNKVCQYMHRPTVTHWSAVKRILRYLKHTIALGFLIRRQSSPTLHAFSNSDWAGCPDDRRSTSGFCVFLGSNLVSWSSWKQKTVSRSSTEAEYRAIANATAEVTWLQSLLRELGLFLPNSPTLWCDNIGATYLTANPVFHARTKHIEIDLHFVREKVASGCLSVRFLSTKDQLADVFTKPLVSNRFSLLRSNLNVTSLPLRLRGPIETSSDKPPQQLSKPVSDNSQESTPIAEDYLQESIPEPPHESHVDNARNT
jgi:hypothetical protein